MDRSNPAKLSQKNISYQPDDGNCKILIIHTIIEILFLITLSRLLHLVLKRFGQPRIVSHMLAGLFLGPIIFSNFELLSKDKIQLEYVASTFSIFFMFLAGLEIDISYLHHTVRSAVVIITGNVIVYVPISMLVTFLLCHFAHNSDEKIVFFLAIFLMFFNTSSPTLIQVINDLKLTMTDIGRVAISIALITDVSCLLTLGLLGFVAGEKTKEGRQEWNDVLASGVWVLVIWVIIIFIIRSNVKQVNKRNGHKQFVGIDVVFYLLLLVFAVSLITSYLSYDPMILAFFFGLMIQRDGPTSRTLIEQLSQIVHNIILPIYFGVATLHVNIHLLMCKEVIIGAMAMVFLGMFGKIVGTIIGAKYLGMSMHEGMVISFLLNVRGHVNLMTISMGKKYGIWNEKTYLALLIYLFVNSIIVCPTTAYIMTLKKQTIQHHFKGVEWLNPESELRILACVHSPGDLPMILDLIEISSGPNKCRFAPFILHLIELTGTASSTMLYHQLQDEDINNGTDGSQTQQVNVFVDKFIQETNINLHQLNVISRFDSMHKDLQNMVEDIHASLAIIPFHRKQRFDGKLGVGKADVRKFNLNALHHAPCSIGILVDRSMDKKWGNSAYNNKISSLSLDDNMILKVMVLFIGGPDDREAAAYAGRLALHSCVNLTMVRLLPKFKQRCQVHYFTNSISCASDSMEMQTEREDIDETFMSKFYDRFIITGIVKYVERVVENSTELIEALSSLKEMYSLYIVGKQVKGSSIQLTAGMSDWEECPELGSIGDLLSSSDFMIDGSVLVIQQCKATISATS